MPFFIICQQLLPESEAKKGIKGDQKVKKQTTSSKQISALAAGWQPPLILQLEFD